jgi:ubiquinol-cytochrome c reductase iron-sulfur subunit
MADHKTQDTGTRRDFLQLATTAMGAVGAGCLAWPLIDSMNAAADTRALASIEVDLSKLAPGQAITVMWRGKPVFIRHRTEEDIAEAESVGGEELRDPQTDRERTTDANGVHDPKYLVMVGICTHLGCVPLGQSPTQQHGEYGGWFCPCHGSVYDKAGRIRKGPAPRNLEVPTYKFTDSSHNRVVIG